MNVAIVQRRLPHYRLPLYDGITQNNPDLSLCLYCGPPDSGSGGSGIPLSKEDPPYVRRVKTYAFNFLGRTFFVQPRVIWYGWRSQYDVVVCEGSIRLLSSIAVLLLRRILGRTSIIWAKGWPYSYLDGKLTAWIRGAFLRLAHAYIVYGEEGKKNLLSYGIPEERITVAQNTVEVEDLLHRDRYAALTSVKSPLVRQVLELNQPYIFNIGRHVLEKRVADLLKAVRILKSEQLNSDICFVIAGEGPETETLKELAKDLKLDGVYFIGQVSDHDAKELFFRSAFCVFPGAVGLALNQAMACKKAVICADEPGPDSELLVHGVNGLRYQPRDSQELANYISRLIQDPELQHRLGWKARETIRTSATIENMVDKYAVALRSSINQ